MAHGLETRSPKLRYQQQNSLNSVACWWWLAGSPAASINDCLCLSVASTSMSKFLLLQRTLVILH